MNTPQSLLPLEHLAKRIRVDIIRSTTAAGSGHLTSSLSSVELITGLLFGGSFRADAHKPEYANNDRLIFSKGHAAPLLYAAYAAAGVIPRSLLSKLRRFGSPLEGHPTARTRYWGGRSNSGQNKPLNLPYLCPAGG